MSVLTDIGYRHSPSKINGWVNAPTKSIAEQMFNIKSLSNDKMKRGNVVESATRFTLHRDPTDEDLIKYIRKSWDLIQGEDEKNIQWIFNSSKLFTQALEERQLKRPKIYQEKFQDHLPSYKFYQIGFADFTYDNITVDLKSTGALPSEPKTDHIRQQAFYWGLSGKKRKFALLYSTNKKYNFFEIPQKLLVEEWKIVQQNMKWIERIDDMCNSKQDWLDMFPVPDTNTFYYKDSGNFQQQIKNLLKGEQNADN